MSFDYAASGLPDNKQWKAATVLCNEWLNRNMSMFGPERIARFMLNQPVTAAKLIMENCPDWSEESVTLALLGPAKESLLAGVAAANDIFSTRTTALLAAMAGKGVADAAMERDMTRLFLVEGLSTMNDQLIGRKQIDKHHQVRWNILHELEKNFSDVKGKNPALDVIFAQALKDSRAALQALDAAVK